MDIFDKKGINPMLISEEVKPYDDPDSIFELKLDGIRCIAYCDNNSVDLRNKRDIKLLPRFPELEYINKRCRSKCILDGELIVAINGKPDFFEVQRRTVLSNPFKIQLASNKYQATFVAYDVIYYQNRLVTHLPLMERKDILSNLIEENNAITISRYIQTYGKDFFELAKKQELEGIVGKKKISHYHFGKRSKDWKKIKVKSDYEAVIIGYISKEETMSTLVLAMYDADNNLTITNHVSLGVNIGKLKQLGMTESKCPLVHIPKGYEDAVWVKPIVGTFEYMPGSKETYRQSIFKGILNDVLPIECRINQI